MYSICIISYFKGKFIFTFSHHYFNEHYVLHDEYTHRFDINHPYTDNMRLMCNSRELHVTIHFKFT